MKGKLRKIQILRRTVQLVTLAGVLAIPVVARYNNYLASRELDKHLEKWDGSIQGNALAVTDAAFRALPNGEKERAGRMVRNRKEVLKYAQAVRGGPWSVQLGPLTATDPLAAAESLAASKQARWVLLVSLIIPVVLTILLGRVFCAWICPMYLFLEGSDKLRGLLKFLEVKPGNMRFWRGIKYVLLAMGLVMAAVLAVPVLGYVYPPAIVNREAHDLVFGIFDRAEGGKLGFWAGGLTWMSLLLVAIAVFEIAVSRRWWCRYVCPGGALYALLGRLRVVRVRRTASRCTHCNTCITVCPEGLTPVIDKFGPECDNCGICISHCEDRALNYTVRRKEEKEEG